MKGGGRRGLRPEVSLRPLFALIGTAIAALLPFLPLLLLSRGMRPDQIGVVLASMALARLVANPVWGHIADVDLGRVRTLRVCTAGSLVMALLFAVLGHGFASALAMVSALAMCWTPVVPLGDALALAHLGAERLVEYGRIRQWSSIGYAIAVVLFGIFLRRIGYTAMLPIFAMMMAAIGAWAWLASPDRPAHEAKGGRFGSVGAAFRAAPRLAAFLAGVLLVGVGTSAAWLFLPLRIVGRGGGPFLVGLAGGIGAGIEVPVMRSSRSLSRRLPIRAIYAIGCLSYVGVFALWAVVPNPVVVAMLAIFEGIGFGLVYVAIVIVIGRLVPAALQATGQGLMQTVGAGLAPILGAFFGGLVYQHLGAPALFGGAAMLVAAGTTAVWLTLSPAPFSRRAVPEAEPVPPTIEAAV